MKIGLVGIPGSGKSALAQSLKNALEQIDNENYDSIAILDNYVEELQEEVDLALGFFGTYIGNLHIALKREAKERTLIKDNKVVISCGTLFETSSYTGQYLDGEYQMTTNDDERFDIVLRTEAISRTLSCLYADTFNYDHIFYLPPVKEVEDVRAKDLEKNLQAAFNAFKLYPVTSLLVEGEDLLEITENRLKTVLEKVLNADNAER